MTTDSFLTRSQALTRLSNGDTLYMEYRDGVKCWWFDGPYEEVGDDVIQDIAFKPGRVCELVEHGDSLFGKVNSQTWKARPLPQRIKLSRKKGWRMPPNTVIVDRRSKWGNPWQITYEPSNGWCVLDPMWVRRPKRFFCSSRAVAQRLAVRKFRQWARSPFCKLNFDELRGKNVACWCADKYYCHGDPIIEIANKPEVINV